MSSSNVGKRISKEFTFWHDREVRFDVPKEDLRLRDNCEEVFAVFKDVEDNKSGGGYKGLLQVTNLRFIWRCDRKPAMNLSIGFLCVQNISVSEGVTKSGQEITERLSISTKYHRSHFRFFFSLSPRASKMLKSRFIATTQAVWKAYDSTKVYRELRLRSATVQDGNLVVLPRESVISKVPDVTNLSKDRGHRGVIVVTTVRVVWFAKETDNFNVSIPYLQFTSLCYQVTEKGPLLVITTSPSGGGLTLGFGVPQLDRLKELYKETSSMWKSWTSRPELGVQVEVTNLYGQNGREAARELFNEDAPVAIPNKKDGENVLVEAPTDAFAAYYADEGQKGADRKPVFEPSIGLAVEKLRKGVTLSQLWEVAVN